MARVPEGLGAPLLLGRSRRRDAGAIMHRVLPPPTPFATSATEAIPSASAKARPVGLTKTRAAIARHFDSRNSPQHYASALYPHYLNHGAERLFLCMYHRPKRGNPTTLSLPRVSNNKTMLCKLRGKTKPIIQNYSSNKHRHIVQFNRN
jgi:hypothetical protein